MTDLEIYAGNDKIWTITVKDSDGDPIDITGYTFLFTLKVNSTDVADDAIITKNITTHTSPTAGITSLTINRADTVTQPAKNYSYDIQMVDTSDKRITLLIGTFRINESVTDRDVA